MVVVVAVEEGEGEGQGYSYDASMCSSPGTTAGRSAPITAKNAAFIIISTRYAD